MKAFGGFRLASRFGFERSVSALRRIVMWNLTSGCDFVSRFVELILRLVLASGYNIVGQLVVLICKVLGGGLTTAHFFLLFFKQFFEVNAAYGGARGDPVYQEYFLGVPRAPRKSAIWWWHCLHCDDNKQVGGGSECTDVARCMKWWWR